MKLTEAFTFEPILLESFGQLKTSLENLYIAMTGTTTPSNADWAKNPQAADTFFDLNRAVRRASQLSPDFPSDPNGGLTAKSTLEIIRFLIKDPRGFKTNQNLNNTGEWIKFIKKLTNNQGVEVYFAFGIMLEQEVKKFIKIVSDPANQKGKIKEVKKTNKFHIVEMQNYAAAREICNKFNLNWCIGSSTPGWFEKYGSERGRKSYAVSFPDKSIISVHMGRDGFLFTDQKNQHEYGNDGRDRRGDSLKAILAQAKKAGLELEDFMDMVEYIAKDSMGQQWIGVINDDVDSAWARMNKRTLHTFGLQHLLYNDDEFRIEADHALLGISKNVESKGVISYAFVKNDIEGTRFKAIDVYSGDYELISITTAHGREFLYDLLRKEMNLSRTEISMIKLKIHQADLHSLSKFADTIYGLLL